MFVEAFVGWLVSEASGTGLRAAARALAGSPGERSLRRVCREAVGRAVVEAAPIDDRTALADALLRAPGLTLPNGDSRPGPAIRNSIECWVAPLAEPVAAGVPSYLAQIGVDADGLVDALCTQIVAGVRRAAVSDVTLHPLAVLLDHNELFAAAQRVEAATHDTRSAIAEMRGDLRRALAVTTPPAPDQFPAAVALSGRSGDLAHLEDVRSASDAIGAPTIVVITGPAGSGKSALALGWLHSITRRFDGGRLFAPMHACDGQDHASPFEVLGGFLRALGVLPNRMPADLAGRTALFRTLTSDRPIAAILDDALSAAQVRPLLPGGRGSVVVVTSRWRLASLGTDGARHLHLTPLDEDSSVELLAARIGTARAAAEPRAVRRLAQLCGRLPLALSVAGARLATRPRWSVAELAGALAGDRDRLDTLAVSDEVAVREALNVSCASLTVSARRMYRLLAGVPGTTFDRSTAAAATGQPVTACRTDLGLLADVNLLGDVPTGRYQFHDLVRVHAREQSAAQDGGEQQEAARERVLDYRLRAATEAEALLAPSHRTLGRTYRNEIAVRPPFDTATGALEWLESEHGNLMAAIRAARTSRPAAVWQLVDAMWPLFLRHKHYDDWIAAHEIGRAAAEECGDDAARNRMMTSGGLGLLGVGRFDEAGRLFAEALADSRRSGDARAEAGALNYLGLAARRHGDSTEAGRWFSSSLAVWRRVGELRGTGLVRANLGELALADDRLDEAARVLAQARDELARAGDPYDEARTLLLLGDTLARSGAGGIAELEAAHDAFRRLGSGYEQAHTRELLGDAAARAGRVDLARDHYCRARERYAMLPVPAERVDRVDMRLAALDS